ncbi:hypothetical protein KFL_006260030 [Klebsormidium nitens]|uniref:S-adenosyl-L-methionine-dependent methyltransferase n=1 Tax=Klebsormidium nitens TaxID=105231 RepID=A0A1Y1INX7_KLENI|nr:hypothetical protein KFL_006260030 [Klebsormidium nitens]|eukprot:GAQ90317.1 hypothetical protein KFL_006260030 [Klebsormidium nitens]
MKREQARLARQAATDAQKPLPNDHPGRQAASGSEQEDFYYRELEEESNDVCGCNEPEPAKSFWAKGWHPRVDNSALGFEENSKEGLNGLQDVVSYTAVSFAAYRAIESERPDALFQDPLAAYLAGDRVVSRQKAEVANKDYPGARFAVRTKYFDLAMMSAIEEMKAQNSQAKVQVVLFGCGMDARSWRLPATLETVPPADKVFEGDRPDVMGLKEQLLSIREEAGGLPPLTLAKQRVVLAVDFNTDTWKELILQKGFRKSEPTVWLFEGLIMYLTPAGVTSLVETVAEFSAPGSVLLIDGISASAVDRAKSSPSPVLRSWTWGSNDPETFFNAHGWRVTTVDDVTGGMFGRVLPSWPGRERNLTWYMTAKRE